MTTTMVTKLQLQFKKGEGVKKVSEENLLEELKKLIAEDLKN